jgi:hypothetical protein
MTILIKWKFNNEPDHYEMEYNCDTLQEAIKHWCDFWLDVDNPESEDPTDYCDFFTTIELGE